MCLPEAFSTLQWFVGERTFRRQIDRPQDSLGHGDKPCVQACVEVAGLSTSCSGAREAGDGEPRVCWAGRYWEAFTQLPQHSRGLATSLLSL